MVQTLERKQTESSNTYLKNKFPNGFCSAPFSQLFIYPTGDVYICCQGVGHLGNLKDNSLEELWNGEKIQLLRKEFLSGEIKTCKKLMDSIGCHINYDDNLQYADFKLHQDNSPSALEIILNGKCNISCIMCETKDELNSVLDIPNFRTELNTNTFKKLKRLNIKGGEPFIQNETFFMIDHMNKTNPDCEWIFTTNGQYQFGKKVKNALESIHLNKITFSIDSSNPQLFQEIRNGANLEITEKTISKVKEWISNQNKKIELTLNITIQKQNWKDVPTTMKHYDYLGINPCLIYVYYPSNFSLSTLSTSDKIEILNFYINLDHSYDKYAGSFYHVLKPLLSTEDPIIKKLKAIWNFKIADINNHNEKNCNLNH